MGVVGKVHEEGGALPIELVLDKGDRRSLYDGVD